jgi:hypothetical protein
VINVEREKIMSIHFTEIYMAEKTIQLIKETFGYKKFQMVWRSILITVDFDIFNNKIVDVLYGNNLGEEDFVEIKRLINNHVNL